MTPKAFLIDVDGVMTDGKFYYTETGKVMKVFGADDHDGLNLLAPWLEVQFLTGDHRGFEISRARIEVDMKMPITLVSTVKRIDWIRERWNPAEVVYMGDGIFDHYVFRQVGYSIATANADRFAKEAASYVTTRAGGDRAVAEASIHLLEKFFKPYDPLAKLESDRKMSGHWST